MQRRKFIKNAAIGAAVLSGSAFSAVARNSFMVKRKDFNMFIGTPVLPEILYERGIPPSAAGL